jgi:hypothetical protein
MTAFHVMTLSGTGEADTPAGGSVCMRLKSRIKRRRAAVDMMGDLSEPEGSEARVGGKLESAEERRRAARKVLLENTCTSGTSKRASAKYTKAAKGKSLSEEKLRGVDAMMDATMSFGALD